MTYQVPQFIEEDIKLMGLITFTQLWILLSFVALTFISFLIFPFWFFIIAAVILLPSGFVLALIKVSGVYAYKLVFSAIRHLWLPKYYLWKKAKVAANYFPEEKTTPEIQETESAPLQKKSITTDVLNKLSNTLDQ